MTTQLKHNKEYTDDEIRQYCESVEQLLVKIKEKSSAKRRKKIMAVEEKIADVEEEEEHLIPVEDELEVL